MRVLTLRLPDMKNGDINSSSCVCLGGHGDVQYIPECDDQVPRHRPSIFRYVHRELVWVCVAEDISLKLLQDLSCQFYRLLTSEDKQQIIKTSYIQNIFLRHQHDTESSLFLFLINAA